MCFYSTWLHGITSSLIVLVKCHLVSLNMCGVHVRDGGHVTWPCGVYVEESKWPSPLIILH